MEHEDAPLPLNLPALQLEHTDAPEPEYFPVGKELVRKNLKKTPQNHQLTCIAVGTIRLAIMTSFVTPVV